MKQNKLFYGMALLATLGLAGCSNDLPGVDPDNQPSDVDRKVYVNLAISGDMVGTRAGSAGDNNGNPVDDQDDADKNDFVAGTDRESIVEDVYFVFYDDNGMMVGEPVAMNVSQFTEQEAPNPSGTVEKRYYQIVEVDVLKGQTAPTQVMCYVNAISSDGLRNPLSQIQTVTRDGVTKKNAQDQLLFPMSNSVYYADNAADQPVVAAQIPTDGAFTTYAAAKAELDKIAAGQTSDYVTEIYLERYASRLTFNFPTTVADYTAKAGNATGTYDANAATFTLTFNVDGWDLNAQSKTTYAVKSFRATDPAGTILEGNDSYETLNSAINGTATTNTWTWNNATYHRSYWAKSPAYFQSTYPEVASDVNGTSNQQYLTYNEIATNGNKDIDGQTKHYYMETTVGQNALNSPNPAAAMPSIVVVGHYTMKNGETAVENTTGQTGVSFYTYGKYPETTGTGNDATTTEKPFIYFENNANSITSAVTGGTSIFERFLNAQTTLYTQVNTDGKISYVKMTADQLVNLCEVKHPDNDQLVSGEKLADRRVSLQLKADANTAGIYVAYNGAYNTIGTAADETNHVITLATANIALRNQIGYAIHYTGGKGFFNIPVQHYGFWRADNPNKGAKKIDWTKVRVGDFGMVRNHVYEIEVTGVTGLATGINGPNIAIIPPRDYQEYFMAIRFNILKWAIVPKQGVIL